MSQPSLGPSRPAPAPVPTRALISTSSIEAGGVLSPGCDLWLWRRRLHPPLQTYTERLASSPPFTVRTRLTIDGRHDAIAELVDRAGAEAGPDREILAQDIGSLAHLFASLTKGGEVIVRLENDPAAFCPLFHVDSVGLRLVCTYSGHATEWLARGDADRHQLGLQGRTIEQANAQIVRGPIQRLSSGHVAILKGSRFAGGCDQDGVVHRSPEPGPVRRLFLAIDEPQDSDA